MQALLYYLVIKDIEPKLKKSASGLELNDELRKDIRYRRAEVISVGSEVKNIEIGDEVLYDKNAGHFTPEQDGENFKVVTVRDIILKY